MSDQAKPNWLVVCRAADRKRDGAHAEAKLGLVDEPTDEDLAGFREGIGAMFEGGFGRKPERVGVAVLPWVDEIDDPDDDD